VGREDVQAAVDRALARLRSDAVDLLQFHAWSYSDPSWLDAVFYLQEMTLEGRVRHLGVTNFDTDHLRMLLHSGVDVVSNQVCYSLVDRRPGRAMASLCEDHGVRLLAYGTLAGGFLTDRWMGAPEPAVDELPTWSLMKYKRFIEAAGGWDVFQGVLDAAAAVARRHDVSIANVATRWVLDRPGVGGVIIGARPGHSDHIEDNARLFSFRLDDADRDTLEPALKAMGLPPGEPGDEYRRPPFLTAAGDLSHHFDTFPAPYPVVEGEDGRYRALSGTVWEEMAGFSRATRVGDRILVSGTTATHGTRVVGGRDAAAQTVFCLDKIEGAIRSLGGSLEDIVRTRVYIRSPDDQEAVSRVHGRRLGHVGPANTLVQAGIIGDAYLVEIEAEAVVVPR
jgi:aryl-alcohol dehydrogenase-like predicted oxidoreductase/enamine deaminase RidA (YjgF/YER057c/UK114 family)